jgi:hypothetical protein
MSLTVRLRLERAWENRYRRLGPGWFKAERVSQDELRIDIPGRPPVAGDTADFEVRELMPRA